MTPYELQRLDTIEAKLDRLLNIMGAVPPPKPLTPGSFPARRQAALDALNKKMGGK